MKLATLDFETDPFKHGREVAPFACGLYLMDDSRERYIQTWGDSCVNDILTILKNWPESLRIYAHNGGKFDFYFLADAISNPLQFIQTRLVKAALYHHEIRDSFAIMPVPLSALEKDSMDYSIMEYEERDKPKNKQAITDYLRHDCQYLYEHIAKFIETFGLRLTLGGTSLKTLKKHHKFKTMNAEQDRLIRPYYFGGRVQCFESGAIVAPLQCYDINSSYPFAMKNVEHPANAGFMTLNHLPDSGFYFARIVADSDGALPIRTLNGLQFPNTKNTEFLACSHEIQTAQDLGLLKIKQVLSVYTCAETQSFAEFVDRCIFEKIAAQNAGDASMRLFWKLVANAAYGKFGQNPENYTDSKLFDTLDAMEKENAKLPEPERWIPKIDYGQRILCERPPRMHNYLNVAIAASITSAARAHLLRAIAGATRPIYTDTDSLICSKAKVKIHKTELGAWKNEGSLDSIFIAGKKIYAGFLNGECVKLACKGAKLSGEQIKHVVETGETIEYKRDAPSIRMFHPQRFITRKIKCTS